MTIPSIDIATAGAPDIIELVQLIRQYWEYEQLKSFNSEAITALITEIVEHPELGQCWIARNASGIQGYLVCSCVPSLEYGGVLALIADLYIASEARRSGVGQQLVNAAEQAMRARGCVHIAMDVAAKNVRAQQFYSILGFATRAGYSMMHKAL